MEGGGTGEKPKNHAALRSYRRAWGRPACDVALCKPAHVVFAQGEGPGRTLPRAVLLRSIRHFISSDVKVCFGSSADRSGRRRAGKKESCSDQKEKERPERGPCRYCSLRSSWSRCFLAPPPSTQFPSGWRVMYVRYLLVARLLPQAVNSPLAKPPAATSD